MPQLVALAIDGRPRLVLPHFFVVLRVTSWILLFSVKAISARPKTVDPFVYTVVYCRVEEVAAMPSATVRISEQARKTLRELSSVTGQPMQTVLDEAIESYRRQRFLEEANAAFKALRENQDGYRAELEERQAWEDTLTDDLEEE
jgi:predicted DNA-binding protein